MVNLRNIMGSHADFQTWTAGANSAQQSVCSDTATDVHTTTGASAFGALVAGRQVKVETGRQMRYYTFLWIVVL
jgi:hypothetical protein